LDITRIPFNHFIGLESAEGTLCLRSAEHLQNHIGTVHASAQFALAEAASGLWLQERFSGVAGEVVPILRRCEMKYRAAATGTLTAHASSSDDEAEAFVATFRAKGRALIDVSVEVRDESQKVTAAGRMEWFVQRVEQT
jgi:acyl-coenzyme A thioesterase PaaI-like protein